MSTLGALSPVRAAIGIARLAFPDTVIPGLGSPLDTRGRRVVQVLGARQITQALVTGRHATAALLWLGVEVDAAHAASLIALAAISPRYRRDALGDAAIAVMLAAAGVRAARAATANPAGESGLAGWRDRGAERLAGHLVPSYAL
ncbi:MAG: hypothetical protein ACRD0Z_12680 [Acidimicrobiales bacterium]